MENIPGKSKAEKNVKKRRLQNHARNDRGEILSIFHTGRHGIRQILEKPIFLEENAKKKSDFSKVDRFYVIRYAKCSEFRPGRF